MKKYNNSRGNPKEDSSEKKGIFYFDELGFGWVVDVPIICKINPLSKGRDISERVLKYLSR